MTEQTAVRVAPVKAGTYEIDPSHSTVEFVARHLMITKVRGRFGGFSGALTIGESPEASSVHTTIDATTIQTGDEKRDGHLRSADFLDVDNHPVLEFVSTRVAGDPDRWKVTGDLTIRGISRPVTLDVVLDGTVTDPWGGERVAFTASTEINREDWGLTWNQVLESGGVVVSRNVRIEISIEAVLA